MGTATPRCPVSRDLVRQHIADLRRARLVETASSCLSHRIWFVVAILSAVSHSIWPVVATSGSGTNSTSGWPPTAMSWRRSSTSSACRPTPSVVLAIEGETEELTVSRIIVLLEPAGQHGHIRVRNLHGTRRDLILLADELARPLAGAPASGNWLTLCQLPTRLLVVIPAH